MNYYKTLHPHARSDYEDMIVTVLQHNTAGLRSKHRQEGVRRFTVKKLMKHKIWLTNQLASSLRNAVKTNAYPGDTWFSNAWIARTRIELNRANVYV